jgi:hypothetical protein
MKSQAIVCSVILMLSAISGSALGGQESPLNTFYGQGAGNSTAPTFGGINNTYIGAAAGYSGGSAKSNTFVGWHAGYSNTGSENTFIGTYAGMKNTSASYNTFVGTAAGQNNTIGRFNTFVGNVAGLENTTGISNTFVGSHAGLRNKTGRYNTLIGNYAGSDNNSGYYNTFLRYYADRANVGGHYNTFIGMSAGRSNTSGQRNTYIGYSAGHYNTSGLGNVFLGARAGYYEEGSNRLYIDNTYTHTPLIYGEFDNDILAINGSLGIGTTAPVYPLEMASGAHVTAGGVWTDASSRAFKDKIETLSLEEALGALLGLQPVKFEYKASPQDQYVGFIAEDVPELVAMKDRKGLSAMDVVAVLTKVVQEQQRIIKDQQNAISALSSKVTALDRLLR